MKNFFARKKEIKDDTEDLIQSLKRQRYLNIEGLLKNVRTEINLAKFCKENEIPLVQEYGFVDPFESIVLYSYKNKSILDKMNLDPVMNKDTYWWFHDKESYDNISRENPERVSFSLNRKISFSPFHVLLVTAQ